ncbi:hypothetical protein KY359_03440 [Candidatus Woesearchaeota archaeon]|nr:hypothetical protein [Candidatus Woesearchaeota archaeon]
MDDGVIRSILDGMGSRERAADPGSLCFCETGYRPVKFSEQNFHSFHAGREVGTAVTFIDGGNAEIFSSPDACVHFVRIFHTTYRDNLRISCSADEFYVFAKAARSGDSVVFSARLFKSKTACLTDSFFAEDFTFNPLDSRLLERSSRLSISKVPGIVRRLAELSTALILVGKAEKGSVVVIDGDLNARLSDETKLINALGSVARSRQAVVCGLSKTSSLLTSDGISVFSVLESGAPDAPWYYYPAAVSSSADVGVSFVKLHPKSGYIFKLESFHFDDGSKVMFPLLAANSTDPVFLGYPYGMIEADRFARVSNREAEYLRTVFMAKAGKSWELIESAAKALDAHSVLDRIS